MEEKNREVTLIELGKTQDHKFGQVLRDAGWNGDTRVAGYTIEYLLPNGEVVARGVWDNKSSTYTAFIKEGTRVT
jgi:hypothetical protein